MRWLIGRTVSSLACLSAILGLLMAAATADAANSQGGTTESKLMSEGGYTHLLDAVFPREKIASLKVAYAMVLRFEPNEGPESQRLFRVWHDGHIDAQLYTIKSGSAWSLANSYIARSGKEDVAAIAPLIPVEKKQLELSAAEVEQWHTGLFGILRASDSALQSAAAEYAKNGRREAVLDGTRYQFWYMQGETELSWSFSDIDVKDTLARANLPLARWMNSVRVASVRKQ